MATNESKQSVARLGERGKTLERFERGRKPAPVAFTLSDWLETSYRGGGRR
jgi:hypothetical protein